MNDLLESALAAHGGLDRWREIRSINARARVTGPLWALKGWRDALADTRVTAEAHRQRLTYSPFLDTAQRGEYAPDRTAIVAIEGLVAGRNAPRAAFEGHELGTQWDVQHVLYFAGYAMWTYLTTPFLLATPGFTSEEIDPWNENGETWRRLRVVFPDDVHSHSKVQIFYFDTSGLLRRHDYSVDIMGGTSSANYAMGHRRIGGLVFPTTRRAYVKDASNRSIVDRMAVEIDLREIELT